jgi:hypothetical protein
MPKRRGYPSFLYGCDSVGHYSANSLDDSWELKWVLSDILIFSGLGSIKDEWSTAQDDIGPNKQQMKSLNITLE